ncbi:MAG: RES family NAD+ phosphorylase [Actinomycetota bacterium]|nr:RES family NAD+ phosphorylase [Actinomycetota bacterium]
MASTWSRSLLPATEIRAPGFDPRSGEGARRFGGRFNPPKSLPVVYLCLTKRCVVTELARQAERQSIQVEDLLPRELWSVTAELTGVLDLTAAAALSAVAIDPTDLVRPDHAFTQELGEAAHERGIQAIRSPSVTGIDEILAIFPGEPRCSRHGR